MNGHWLDRLAELERAVDGTALGAEVRERPAHMLTDAECVEAWHRLCRRPVAPPEPVSDRERDQIVAASRELTA